MPISVTIPRLGWNMEEGTFVEWLKADGDAVKPGDAVFRLEGEKATEDVESLDAGTLHIPADGPKTGDKIAVGAVIGWLLQAGDAPPGGREFLPPAPAGGEGGESASRVRGEASSPSCAATPLPVVAHAATQPPSPGPPGNNCEEAQLFPSGREEGQEKAVTPRARRLAARLGVDAAQLRGSGRNGRVRERDIPAPLPTSARHVIAARMMESRRTTAPVTLTSAVDATNLVSLREQFKTAGEAVPSYTDLMLKFAAVALQRHPALAAQWADAGITPAASIDIGFAVDAAAGLLVPVVRNVPALGLRAIAARTRELIERARTGALSGREMGGACFTITNLGAFGVDAFTPIVNPPECAILGVGRIERRPVMDGDRVIGRDLVTLSLTFDHRIVDGAPAARFLQTLAACVVNPAPWVSS